MEDGKQELSSRKSPAWDTGTPVSLRSFFLFFFFFFRSGTLKQWEQKQLHYITGMKLKKYLLCRH